MVSSPQYSQGSCYTCHLQRPLRSKHCVTCDRYTCAGHIACSHADIMLTALASCLTVNIAMLSIGTLPLDKKWTGRTDVHLCLAWLTRLSEVVFLLTSLFGASTGPALLGVQVCRQVRPPLPSHLQLCGQGQPARIHCLADHPAPGPDPLPAPLLPLLFTPGSTPLECSRGAWQGRLHRCAARLVAGLQAAPGEGAADPD